jgi:hypothetical protein
VLVVVARIMFFCWGCAAIAGNAQNTTDMTDIISAIEPVRLSLFIILPPD